MAVTQSQLGNTADSAELLAEEHHDGEIREAAIAGNQRVNLIDALKNRGVAKHAAGIRLYNQKYFTVNHDPAGGDKAIETTYLKKVKLVEFRAREVPALPRPRISTLSAHGTLLFRWKMASLRIRQAFGLWRVQLLFDNF